MSQHIPTPKEIDSFAHVLWEKGPKKMLLAFRATWPDSKATNGSASVQAYRVAALVSIKERVQALHAQSRSVSDNRHLLDVLAKKTKLFDIVENSTQLLEREGGIFAMIDPRAAIAAIAESNRMDGEYEKDNAQQHDTVALNINLAGHPTKQAGSDSQASTVERLSPSLRAVD